MVRPVRKTTDTIPVKINLYPVGLRDVDVKSREIKFDSWLHISWEDAYLTWSPEEYAITQLVLSVDQIWKPDISVYTAVSDEAVLPNVMTNAIVFHNGTILWVPPVTIKSRCQPTADQITEDTFHCTVILGSWTYHVHFLNVHGRYEDPLTRAMEQGNFFNAHPKWILATMKASTEEKKYDFAEELYSTVKYDLGFRKRRDTDI